MNAPRTPKPVDRLRTLVRVAEPGAEEQRLIGLDRNERLAPLPDAFLENIRGLLTSDLLTSYPMSAELTRALEDALGLEAGALLLTPGSDGAVKAVFHTFVSPGDEVVLLDPSYAMYGVYAEMVGARAVRVPFEDGLELNVDRLLDSVGSQTRLVVLANPNQPTGTLLPRETVIELAHRAQAVGAVLAVDEAYFPFSKTTVLPSIADEPNLVVLRTFSKAAGLAGLRIGYAAATPEVIANLFKVRSVHDVNAFAIQCVMALLDHPEVIDDYAAAVDAGEQALRRRLAALGLEAPPTACNFVLVDVAERCSPAELVERLRKRGFLVRGPFSAPALARFIRVTLGPPELMEAFADALGDALSETAD